MKQEPPSPSWLEAAQRCLGTAAEERRIHGWGSGSTWEQLYGAAAPLHRPLGTPLPAAPYTADAAPAPGSACHGAHPHVWLESVQGSTPF